MADSQPSVAEAQAANAALPSQQSPSTLPKKEKEIGLMTSWSMQNSVRIVKGEIHNVLSLMRLNRRYNTGARFHREIPSSAESPLVRGLKALHEELGPYTDLQDMDTLAWLRPFLEVVESAETTGPITGGALSSLSKFLNYGFIHMGSPRAAQSVNRICRIVTRCRFERTDHSGDEVVLVRILQVLLDCLRGPAGTLLSDQNVWDMVRSCFEIGRQPKISELLKRTAEQILMQIILTLFARFSQLQAAEELSQDIHGVGPLRNSLSSEQDADMELNLEADVPSSAAETSDGLVADVAPPYGMPCMYKVLEFLCKLTHAGDSSDAAASEASRMLGLSLLNVVLETGGRQISACPALVAVIQHDLSRNLLQNSRTSNLQILSLTLRVVFNMFNSVREHMKVQLEVFFNSIHLAESSLPETREMALESLVEFCREPQLMVEIYTNYDCDMQCTNLFEDMVKFLSKNTFPLSGSLNALNLLSLEGLLAIVRSLADACHGRRLGGDDEGVGGEGAEEEGDKSVEQLRIQKQHKRRVAIAAENFNRKPTKSSTFEHLQAAGFLPATLDGASIAHFLLNTPGLDRTAVGVYLGEPEELPLATLKAFSNSFDFCGLHLSDALRKFLDAFRLPGESQKIARIVEHFAQHYYEQEPGPLANADTAYILAYAIIMLNTDLHNSQVKKKMTKEDFIKMNRGINDNKDLPVDFLLEIYDSIASNEIKMKTELCDMSKVGSDEEPRWDNLLATMGQKYHSLAFVAAPELGSVHGRDMFLVSWDRIIAALSVVFETTEDKKVLRKTIQGFHDFAKICSFHKLHDEFNKLIGTLSKSLFKFAEQAVLQPERVEEPSWVFVRNAKVQMAAQAMFSISFSYADCLRDGWKPLLDYVAKLHRIRALPAALLEKDDFVDLQGRPLLSSTHVAIKMLHSESSRGAARGRSIFSYLWGSGAAEEEEKAAAAPVTRLGMAGQEELTAFVSSLKLEELLLNTKFLSNGALTALANGLISASSRILDEDVEEEVDASGIGGVSAMSVVLDSRHSLTSAIVCLDLLANTAIANHQRIGFIWAPMHLHLMQLLSSAQAPSLAAERTVVNQVRLCLRLLPIESVRTDLFEGLRALTALPASVLKSLSDRISVGLLTLLREHAAFVKLREDWRSLLSLIQEFGWMAPSASRPALESLTFLLREEGRFLVNATNFDFCQQTLLGFLDSVLDPQVARQHVTAELLAAPPHLKSQAKGSAPVVTLAQMHQWQAATGANIMNLMHCLFLRLRVWKGVHAHTAKHAHTSHSLTYLPSNRQADARTRLPCSLASSEGATAGAAAVATVAAVVGGVPAADAAEQPVATDAGGDGGEGVGGEGLEGFKREASAGVGASDLDEDGFALGLSSQDEQTWCMLWMLYVKSICRIAHDERCALVAESALEQLERALLGVDVPMPYAHAWRDCYNQIVFPIVSAKFKSAASGGCGSSATDALCLSMLLLLCKSFRNNLNTIIHLPELHMMWLRLLGLIEAFKHRIVAKQRDPVSNDIVLVLKEMLQAMNSDKDLKQFQQASGQDMWALTSTVIDAFCPDLKNELMTSSPAAKLPSGHAGSAIALHHSTSDAHSTSDPQPLLQGGCAPPAAGGAGGGSQSQQAEAGGVGGGGGGGEGVGGRGVAGGDETVAAGSGSGEGGGGGGENAGGHATL